MSLLSNLAVTQDIEVAKDSIGGGGPLESGVYKASVKSVHFETSRGGALAANLALDINGREVRQKLWITSGDAKGNKNYYEKDGTKRFLPGFELFRSLTLMTVGKEPSDVNTDEGVLKIWNPQSRKEEPTTVPLARELAGTSIQVGLLKQTVNKRVQNDAGEYVASAETRDENEIDRFFHAESGMTLAEALGGDTAGTFIDMWRSRHEGVTRDRTEKGAAAPARSAIPAFTSSAPAEGTAAKSIFG